MGGLVDAEFQAAVGQQGVVLEYLDGRPLGHDPALVQDDGALAQVRCIRMVDLPANAGQ